jgi:hypothetical protein
MWPRHRSPRLLAALFVLALYSGFSLAHPAPAAAVHVVQSGWDLTYDSPTGDGIPITYAHFNGTLVFARSTLPFVFVYYPAGDCCVDNLSGSVLKSGPTKVNVTNGFTIKATYCFGTCTPYDATDVYAYKYVESYTFLNDGEWVAKLDIYGPGYVAY